jgi:hypothetical protein
MQRIFDDAIQRLLPNLNVGDKEILRKCALELCKDIQDAFTVSEEVLELQLQGTKFRDAMAIITMLLPRIEESKIRTMSSLNMLFDERYNNVQWGRCLRNSTGGYENDREWDISNLKSNFYLLKQSIQTIAHKLHPNWIDIVPISLLKYQNSTVFQKTLKAFSPINIVNILAKSEDDWEDDRYNIAKKYFNVNSEKAFKSITPAGSLSIRDMWSVVSGDLFGQVLQQKLLVHDYNYDNAIGEPVTALFIWDRLLPLENAYDLVRWVDTSDEDQQIFTKQWQSFIDHGRRREAYIFETRPQRLAISSTTLLRMMRILAGIAKEHLENLFRDTEWEDKYMFDMVAASKSSEEIAGIAEKDIGKQELHGDADWGTDIEKYSQEVDYVITALESLPAQAWYMVLSKAFQGIQLSWYGLMLFERNENGMYRPIKVKYPRDTRACTVEELAKFQGTDGALQVMCDTMKRSGCPVIMPLGGDKKCLITVKNIYNWAKSVSHHTSTNTSKDRKKSKSFIYLEQHWDMVELQNVKLGDDRDEMIPQFALHRLCGRIYPNNKWMNLRTYHRAIYTDYDKVNDHNKPDLAVFETTLIRTATMLLPHIITQALIKRGTLTEFKPRPDITDDAHYSGSEEKKVEWVQAHIAADNGPLSSLKRKEYQSAFNFVNGEEYDPKYLRRLATDKGMNWYQLYAMNWVSQISLYHRFLNCRFGMITGATGVGKSTQGPKLMLYALRALEGRSRASIVCTEPRIDITRKNAVEVADQMGVPLMQFNADIVGGKRSLEETGNAGIGYKFKGNTLGLGAPIQLSFITDGSMLRGVLHSAMLKSARKKKVANDKLVDPNECNYNISENNLHDMFMIDEAHEHNIHMDLILSLIRPHLQLNTELRFVTISATLTEFDERRYRSFFRDINDNYKYPFRMLPENADRIDMERLIHIAAPFGGTRYTLTKMPFIEVHHGRNPSDPAVISDVIAAATKQAVELSHSNRQENNDVIIFLPGASEIMRCCEAINSSPELGSGTIAIPYFKFLTEEVRTLMSKIDKPESRERIVWSRQDTLNVLVYGDLANKAGYPIGNSYKQFILVATNIAEASLTISTLRYVIDSGMAKTVTYNPTTRTEKNETIMISKFNSTQRIGRVARTMPGTAYYLYDPDMLNDESLSSYAISSGDLSEELIQMLDPVIFDINRCMRTELAVLDKDKIEIGLKPKNKFHAALIKYWFTLSRRIDTVIKGIDEHRDPEKLEVNFSRFIESHYNPNPMVYLIFDYEMRIYCFHPEEPYIARDKSGTATSVTLSNSRRIMAKYRVLRGERTIVILSDLLQDAKLRLEQLGLLAHSRLRNTDIQKDLLLDKINYTEQTDLRILPLNNSVLKITKMGEQVQAVLGVITEELPPDDDLQFGMNDIVFLMYAHRYNCLREALTLMATLWVCSGPAGPNLANWAPAKEEINKETGRIRRSMDSESFFSAYRHQTSDHLALLRIAKTIDPLYQKVYGDALEGTSRIIINAENDVKKEYRRLLKYKPHVTVRAGVVTVNIPRTNTFGAAEIKDLSKIINDLDEFPSNPEVAFQRFSIRKRAQFIQKRSNAFFNDPDNEKHIRDYANQNVLGERMIRRYMYNLQFLQIGISNIMAVSKMPEDAKKRKYPNIDTDLLTLDSNMYVFAAASKEEAVMRCYLYANPEKIALMDKSVLYYNQNVSIMIPKVYRGAYNGFAYPRGLCIFSGMAESSKLEDVNIGIEVVGKDDAPIKAGIIASVFTNIPSKWLGECNPQMGVDTGFALKNISRRSPGMAEYHTGVLQDISLSLGPW